MIVVALVLLIAIVMMIRNRKKDQITAGYIGNEKHYFGCDCDIGTERI